MHGQGRATGRRPDLGQSHHLVRHPAGQLGIAHAEGRARCSFPLLFGIPQPGRVSLEDPVGNHTIEIMRIAFQALLVFVLERSGRDRLDGDLRAAQRAVSLPAEIPPVAPGVQVALPLRLFHPIRPGMEGRGVPAGVDAPGRRHELQGQHIEFDGCHRRQILSVPSG